MRLHDLWPSGSEDAMEMGQLFAMSTDELISFSTTEDRGVNGCESVVLLPLLDGQSHSEADILDEHGRAWIVIGKKRCARRQPLR